MTNDREDKQPEIRSAWDVWVAEAMEKQNLSLSDARNLVIEKWLTEAGDPRPFFDWVLTSGHAPSHRIIKILAMMMRRADSPGSFPDFDAALQFKLEIKGTGSGRRRDFEALTRDFIQGREISKLMDAGSPHLAAEKDVSAWLKSEGIAVSEATTEKARKNARRGRGKNTRK